jgi:hypothetical protein
VTIKAIETRYAGCRFRSRLEARWAVFFDRIGIEWQYEAQGYDCTHRISLEPGEYRYLPDFWLPAEKCYVEVKGELTPAQTLAVYDRAASLCNREDTRLILAGPIPGPAQAYPPTGLSLYKGCLLASPGLIGDPTADGVWQGWTRSYRHQTCVAHDVGGDLHDVTGDACSTSVGIQLFARDPLGRPCTWKWSDDGLLGRDQDSFRLAYQVARSARFEHGETPSRVR